MCGLSLHVIAAYDLALVHGSSASHVAYLDLALASSHPLHVPLLVFLSRSSIRRLPFPVASVSEVWPSPRGSTGSGIMIMIM